MRAPISVATAALLLLLAGCSGDADPGDGGGPALATAVFADDLESVCRGIAQDGAARLDPAKPGPHPLLVFAGESPHFTQDFTALPEGWTLAFGELERTELVACIDRTEAVFAGECTGYDTGGLEGEYVVELYDARYQVTLYAAATAEDVYAPRCPARRSRMSGAQRGRGPA